MTLPELHPDELLLREASSTLTPSERADLSAHLARCPACALERAVRREATRLRGPSDLDHAIAARVVGRLLASPERLLASPATPAGPANPANPDREVLPAKRGPWSRRLAYAAVALVLISSTAMAGVALVVQIRQREATRVESESRRALAVRPAPKRHRAMVAPAERREGEESVAPDEVVADPSVEASAARGEPIASLGEPARSLAERAPLTIPGAARPPSAGGRSAALNRHHAAVARGEGARADAATLLAQAEGAESAGRLASASRLYGELGRSFPGTREDIVARALHGQLLLDRLGNPARALALFEAYLKAEPAGTLAEEARLGRARSLERLGRSSEERSAWLDLLRVHPRSIHAAAARARLAALDTP